MKTALVVAVARAPWYSLRRTDAGGVNDATGGLPEDKMSLVWVAELLGDREGIIGAVRQRWYGIETGIV